MAMIENKEQFVHTLWAVLMACLGIFTYNSYYSTVAAPALLSMYKVEY